MTNEEKAREIAECCSVMPPTSITQSDVIAMTNNAAMQAIEWKDEEHTKEKQQWIDKAIQFINDKLQGKRIEWKDEYCWSLEGFIKQFKQAMEE